MAKLVLVRVDTRLVHGQTVTKWRSARNVDKYIIVDEHLAKDKFMADFYKMSAPKGTKVEIISQDEAIKRWNENEFGDDGNVGIIFKNIENGYQLYKKGFPKYFEFMVGNCVATKGSVAVTKAIYITPAEYEMLKELQADGIDVYFKLTPDFASVTLDAVASKFNK